LPGSAVHQLVSVIIPNYNHALFLQQRIESVLDQTFQDFEVIILDDASTDDSKTVIENYRGHPKVSHIIYNKQNSGSAFRQWEKGVGLAIGKYIWIAESDDYCDSGFLKEMVDVFANAPGNTGLAYCKSLPVDHNNHIYDYSDWWMKRIDPVRWENDFVNNGENEVADYLAVQCTIPNASAVLFSAGCFKDVDWDSVDFKICGDWYIYASILKKYDIAYSASPMNYHRNHHANARSMYAKRSILEQYRVLCFIGKNFIISKSRVYAKALDERLSLFVALVKNGTISKKDFLTHIFMMGSFDPGYIRRLVRVLYAKAVRIDLNFK
jgi:glycosyltransferase involved in cell wall biosynthesis